MLRLMKAGSTRHRRGSLNGLSPALTEANAV